MRYDLNPKFGRCSLPRQILEVDLPGENLACGRHSLHHCHCCFHHGTGNSAEH